MSKPPRPIRFGIVGTGWRALFYLRIAKARPDLFEVTGLVSRKPSGEFSREWGAPVHGSLDDLLKSAPPSFVVTSVPWKVNPDLIRDLVGRGVPVLSETPPAPDVESLVALNADVTRAGGKVQVAEEYHRRPMNAAQLAFTGGGLLGTVSHAQISVGHGYHGISLMRRHLGIGCEPARITSVEFRAPIVASPGRDASPDREEIRESAQEIYLYDFGGKSGMMDFTGDQYFGHIRRERVLVRGERGELLNDSAVHLIGPATPVTTRLIRHHQDILTGVALRGIQAGDRWIYENPVCPAPITDDEIAIADCLLRMDEYVRTGKPFYPLAEGSQDHYLYLMSQRAVREGATVDAVRQPWAE